MRLHDFVLCDDIRFEQFNKVSIMGVYNEAVNVEAEDLSTIKWPIGLRLGVYLRFIKESSDKFKVNQKSLFSLTVSRVNENQEEVLANVAGEFVFTEESSPYIAFPLLFQALVIPRPCKLLFKFKFGDSTFELPNFEIRTRLKLIKSGT